MDKHSARMYIEGKTTALARAMAEASLLRDGDVGVSLQGCASDFSGWSPSFKPNPAQDPRVRTAREFPIWQLHLVLQVWINIRVRAAQCALEEGYGFEVVCPAGSAPM